MTVERPIFHDRVSNLIYQDSRLGLAADVLLGVFKDPFTEYDLSYESIAQKAFNAQWEVALALEVVDPQTLRIPHIWQIRRFVEYAKDKGGVLILMRHGQQDSKDKILGMQEEHNLHDPLTSESIAESSGTAVIFGMLQAKLRLDDPTFAFTIETSENLRSAQVAALLEIATNNKAKKNPIFNCDNYPQGSSEEINTLIGPEYKGSIPWIREVINRVFGPETYKNKMAKMQEIIKEYIKGNKKTIIVGHTQDTNAVDELLGEKPLRLGELGFRLIRGLNDSLLCKNGFYIPAA